MLAAEVWAFYYYLIRSQTNGVALTPVVFTHPLRSSNCGHSVRTHIPSARTPQDRTTGRTTGQSQAVADTMDTTSKHRRANDFEPSAAIFGGFKGQGRLLQGGRPLLKACGLHGRGAFGRRC